MNPSTLHAQILAGGSLVVLGGGESGVGAALLGKARGWEVLVSDAGRLSEKNKSELEQAGIAFEDGGHTIDKILSADLMVKSPGIPSKTPVVRQALDAGKYVIGEIELAWHYKPKDARIVGITGSNGKSTTTKLTWHLMEQGGLDAAMGGNIGYSFARLLTEAPRDWYVLELSSFQLDDIVDFCPDIAVILNITPDHLDRYDYDFAKYAASKFRITRNQTADDLLILSADDPATQEFLPRDIHARILSFTADPAKSMDLHPAAFANDTRIGLRNPLSSADADGVQPGSETLFLSHSDSPLRGKHNIYNSMAAVISACAAGVRRNTIRQSFATFKGLEHRLESAGAVGGVTFINDSKATNVNSVWFALESMRSPVVLILGGQDKGNDYSELTDLVRDKVKAIVCMGIDNTPILAAFRPLKKETTEVRSANAAVEAAYAFAVPGDVVLLSPGCASFDLFKNYEDRGLQFKAAVAALAKTV